MSDVIYSNHTPILLLECEEAFNLLSEKEKLYAHHLSRACWLGSLIVLLQISVESPLIYSLLYRLFASQSIEELKEVALSDCDFTSDEFTSFLMYTAAIFANLGNYKGYGDTKFIPNIKQEKFEQLVLASKFGQQEPEKVKSLLSKCLESIYSLKDKERQLGFPNIGTTTYLSKNISSEDNEIVTGFLKSKSLEVYNSRLFKTTDENGKISYEIRLASILDTDDEEEKNLLIPETEINSHKFIVTRGDYSKLLSLVNKNLLLAKDFAANETQVQMIEKYIESFNTGSIDAHKDGSRFWIRDKEPIIETYIGFIETYKDPAGVRGEFEGFVAMVNKPMSVKYTNLVKAAEELVSELPWPKEYELDKFLQPEYTSLDILTFACSDVCIGINIPNYEEIRQCEGFKNVTLGNVIRVTSKDPPDFLSKTDQELYLNYRVDGVELQTGLHELLGHGSGKLFKRRSDGTLNFDVTQVVHLESNERISTWYEEGESFHSIFGAFNSPYEECRAECVGLYLSTLPEVLSIFGYEGAEAQTVMYISWLDTVYAGLQALNMYEPSTESWLQAHCQAAFVILQVLLECGEDFVDVKRTTDESGNSDLLFTMDRDKITTVGKECIGKFLRKLQLYKATADVTRAKEMFKKYSAVLTEGKYPFLEYRKIVADKRKPRRILIQPNTFLEDGKVNLKNYPSSAEGLIQSCIERFQGENIDEILEELWAKDQKHFT